MYLHLVLVSGIAGIFPGGGARFTLSILLHMKYDFFMGALGICGGHMLPLVPPPLSYAPCG